MTVAPDPERVPTALLPEATPSTDQVRTALVEPVTAAVKVWVKPLTAMGALELRLTASAGVVAALRAAWLDPTTARDRPRVVTKRPATR